MATVAYRYFHSFRVFDDSGEDVTSKIPLNDTYIDLFDLAATYAVTRRLNLTLELPVQYGSRTNAFEHDGVHVHTMRASGVGDLRLSGSVWLLAPEKHPNQNISLSLGVKAPTGNERATDLSFRPTGPEFRAVDSAIQPGDGGWGIIFSANAFAEVFKDTFVYANSFYLSNPRETNGVHPVNFDKPGFNHGDKGLTVNSVPDQSMVRGGLARPLWKAIGLSASFGVRWEGIPAHDLIGGSDGYRQPGYSLSVEPGLSITHHNDYLSVTAPIAVYRYGLDSVPLSRVHAANVGLASFADYQINITYSHEF